MNMRTIILAFSLFGTLSMLCSNDEAVCFKHDEYQLEQLKNAVDVFKPYKADKRVAEFLGSIDTFLPSLVEKINDKQCFNAVNRSEIVNFEAQHKLMKTYLMVAFLDGKPLGF